MVPRRTIFPQSIPKHTNTQMASLSILSLSLPITRLLPSTHARIPSNGSTQLAFPKRGTNPVTLSSGQATCGSHLLFPFGTTTSLSITTTHRLKSLTVFAAKGYKMKTHKASAKRFRVTGTGKIVRRCAGKQHLLGKKNTKRKKRLSKMAPVNRRDYDNVVGALPYLKVNRKAA